MLSPAPKIPSCLGGVFDHILPPRHPACDSVTKLKQGSSQPAGHSSQATESICWRHCKGAVLNDTKEVWCLDSCLGVDGSGLLISRHHQDQRFGHRASLPPACAKPLLSARMVLSPALMSPSGFILLWLLGLCVLHSGERCLSGRSVQSSDRAASRPSMTAAKNGRSRVSIVSLIWW